MKNDKSRGARKAHKQFWGLVRLALNNWLRARFNLHFEYDFPLQSLAGPFLILPNHAGFWDPFMVAVAFREPVQYVVSNMQFRNPVLSFFLSLLGGIPKTKGVSDLDTIRRIMNITGRGGIVGIFPEGSRTWDGVTLPIIRNTAKLAKKLALPVIIPVIQGAYVTHPRWKTRPGRGKITIRFHRLFDGSDLKCMGVEAVADALQQALLHDDSAYMETSGCKVSHESPAEYIEQALFLCPECLTFMSLYSKKNEFRCLACGSRKTVDSQLRIAPGGHETVREWNAWQLGALDDIIEKALKENRSEPLLSTTRFVLTAGSEKSGIKPLSKCSLALYIDRLECSPKNGEKLNFFIEEIHGCNVQNREVLEFYVGKSNYFFKDPAHRTPSYLWMTALLNLANKMKTSAIMGI